LSVGIDAEVIGIVVIISITIVTIVIVVIAANNGIVILNRMCFSILLLFLF